MKNGKAWILAGLLSIPCGAAIAGENNEGLKVWIESQEANGQIELQARICTDLSGEFSYKLTVERISSAGSSTSSQGGTVTIGEHRSLSLSRSRVNAPGEGTLKARLVVRGPDGTTAEDSLEWPG